MKPSVLFAGLLLAAGLGLGVQGPAAVAAPEPLTTIQGCFVSAHRRIPVRLEVARSPDQRRRGLMERESLHRDSGMLFVYGEYRPAGHGFWMYNTLIPLDIAYLDGSGQIVSIRTMEPCPSSQGRHCPSYPAGTRFIRAVEMNAGFFARKGLGVGDQLVTGDADCPAR